MVCGSVGEKKREENKEEGCGVWGVGRRRRREKGVGGKRARFTADHRSSDRKVSGSSPGGSDRRVFFSIVNFLC